MSIIALYVYNATTFTTDSKIEPIAGDPIDAGVVTLQPGIYRLSSGATINAIGVPKGGASFSVIPLENTKGGPPDPPLSPLTGYTMSEINAFFGGAGQEDAI